MMYVSLVSCTSHVSVICCVVHLHRIHISVLVLCSAETSVVAAIVPDMGNESVVGCVIEGIHPDLAICARSPIDEIGVFPQPRRPCCGTLLDGLASLDLDIPSVERLSREIEYVLQESDDGFH